MNLWHTLSVYFRRTLGRRVQKIPLDAGASCPNRDGTLSRSGCIFCNADGSGSGLLQKGMDLQRQWSHWQEKYARAEKKRDFMAYFQSYSNTYGSAERVRSLVKSVSTLPGAVGISLGTRPDCVDDEKMMCIARCPLPEVWIEFGLQSCHDATLRRINRQHSFRQSEEAVRCAHNHGVNVCAHLMAGLPGESSEDFLESVRWVISLGIQGIKLHNLYICHNTPLAQEYKNGRYIPLQEDAYRDTLTRALPIIPTSVVIHRLTGDPAPGECMGPAWALEKRDFLTKLYHSMDRQNLWQGCQADAPQAWPEWFER